MKDVRHVTVPRELAVNKGTPVVFMEILHLRQLRRISVGRLRPSDSSSANPMSAVADPTDERLNPKLLSGASMGLRESQLHPLCKPQMEDLSKHGLSMLGWSLTCLHPQS